MGRSGGSERVLKKQAIMRRVLVALGPCVAGAVYFFGWRSLVMVMVLVAALTGFVVEFVFTHKRNEPVSEAVFVTTTILALIMPPTAPWHVLIIGAVFAVMFAKEIFGGFGRNFFNPAMAGRCFVYICFPVAMTAVWAPVAAGRWGALNRWTTVSSADAATGATPMADVKAGKLIIGSQASLTEESRKDIEAGKKSFFDRKTFYRLLYLGRVSGTVGVTSVLLILIGGLYLFVTKTASRTIILSVVITYGLLNQILYLFGVRPVPDGLTALLGGGFLFGAFFMATDPISAPRTQEAKLVYGIIIGLCSVIIRNFSIFNGGLMFAILIGNMLAPLLDVIVRSFKTAKSIQEKT
ncbi:MAG: hypothetical protein A2Z25_16325 [Planctomycetes bacterium RBG_16_55_9]|nr:MAG: hypothetical protein A2Z25_16325 [Planctomycetes bacterium RBG_16_55_9]